MEVEKMETKNI